MKPKTDPETIPAKDWQPVTESQLRGLFAAHAAAKKKRTAPKTFLGGYGIVTTAKRIRLPKN